MAVDVLTKGKDRGNTELLQKLMATGRFMMKPTDEMLKRRREKREQKAKETS